MRQAMLKAVSNFYTLSLIAIYFLTSQCVYAFDQGLKNNSPIVSIDGGKISGNYLSLIHI